MIYLVAIFAFCAGWIIGGSICLLIMCVKEKKNGNKNNKN